MKQIPIPFQIRKMFMKARILFVLDNCHFCARWKEFIERINIELPIEKRIKVIDMTIYERLGVSTNPLIKLFYKYIPDKYPSLFFEGVILTGANSRVEV
ncbi:MAG TPA: hypothetical protein VJ438_00230, partial [Candidatus Nanoarchaeia archaeon]|nr:hypothetical protein [Candidatus Nanoarchaeia archaeon]